MDTAEFIETEHHDQSRQLFTLRLWRAELGGGATEWRGQLRHVMSGETRYFREWQALITLLETLLAEAELPQDKG